MPPLIWCVDMKVIDRYILAPLLVLLASLAEGNTLDLIHPTDPEKNKYCGEFVGEGLDNNNPDKFRARLISATSECFGLPINTGGLSIGDKSLSFTEGDGATARTITLKTSQQFLLQDGSISFTLADDVNGIVKSAIVSLDSAAGTAEVADIGLADGQHVSGAFYYTLYEGDLGGSFSSGVGRVSVTVSAATTTITPSSCTAGVDSNGSSWECVIEAGSWTATSGSSAINSGGLATSETYAVWDSIPSSTTRHSWKFTTPSTGGMNFIGVKDTQDADLSLTITRSGGVGAIDTYVAGCYASGVTATLAWSTNSNSSLSCKLQPNTVYYVNVRAAFTGGYHFNNSTN